MLTIAKLLTEPIFATATVVAGRNGLTNTIDWSHIIDVPEVVEMVGGGRHLILTTGQGLPLEPAEQTRFITELAQAGLAGMIVSVGGRFFQKMPPAFIEAADHLDFPIITIPREIRFVDITRTIHEQLISNQYAILKQTDHIHQTLTRIVLEGAGVQELAQVLAQLVNRAVTIEDPELNLLAYADYGEIDQARKTSIERGETPQIIRQFVREQGILDKLQQSLRPVFVPAFPEHGMTKERIVAPIVFERDVYGYLWLIAGDEPLTEADTFTIERAATIAALIVLKETAIRQTEARLQADVLSQLLSEHPNSLAVEDRAKRLGLDLNQPHRVFLLRPPEAMFPSLKLADKLKSVIRKSAARAIIQPLGQNIVLILPDTIDVGTVSPALMKALPGLKIGVGAVAPALVNLSQSYQQAEEALEIGLVMVDMGDVFNFENLGFLHWLYHLPNEAKPGNYYLNQVKILATEEKAARAHLFRTLEAYLDSGGNVAETARILRVHRNTLSYRLKQIETYCRLSLMEPVVRLNLHIAVKAYRLIIGSQE